MKKAGQSPLIHPCPPGSKWVPGVSQQLFCLLGLRFQPFPKIYHQSCKANLHRVLVRGIGSSVRSDWGNTACLSEYLHFSRFTFIKCSFIQEGKSLQCHEPAMWRWHPLHFGRDNRVLLRITGGCFLEFCTSVCQHH